MSDRPGMAEPHDPAQVIWSRGYAVGSMGLALLVLFRGGRDADLESAMLWLLCASFLVSGAMILLEKRSGRLLFFTAAVLNILSRLYQTIRQRTNPWNTNCQQVSRIEHRSFPVAGRRGDRHIKTFCDQLFQ